MMKRVLLYGVTFLNLVVFNAPTYGLATNSNNRSTNQTNVPSPWSGSLSAGFSANTGNTETTDAHGKLDIHYQQRPWFNHFHVTGEHSTNDDKTTANSYSLSNETNYFYKPRYYFFGIVNFKHDEFDPYDFSIYDAIGLGIHLYDSNHFQWDVQAGPGSNHRRISATHKMNNQFVGYAATRVKWDFNDESYLSEKLSVEGGQLNTDTQSVTKLHTKLVNCFGLELSFTADYISHIPKESSNTHKLDTKTDISLTYHFGSKAKQHEYSIF